MSDIEPEAGPFFVLPDGTRSDVGLYDVMLEDEEANLLFDLDVIRELVEEGESLESAMESFGSDAVRRHFEKGGLLSGEVSRGDAEARS